MGRIHVTFAALALGAVVAVSSADAQEASASGVTFGVSGGLAQPMGNLGDFAGTGFQVAGHLGFNPASVPFGLRADVAFTQFGADDDVQVIGGGEVDNFRSIGVGLNAIVKVPTQGTVAPYLLGGPSFRRLTVGVSDGDDPDAENKFGLQVGGGIQFNLSGMSTNLEAKYVHIFTEDESTQFIPITFGINFGGR
jgi:opacity protein-like surface antigen